MGEANFDSESIVPITQDELILLIISLIHTQKKNKKNMEDYKCNIFYVIFSKYFLCLSETLNSLTENESVIVNTF